jgi:serpin B
VAILWGIAGIGDSEAGATVPGKTKRLTPGNNDLLFSYSVSEEFMPTDRTKTQELKIMKYFHRLGFIFIVLMTALFSTPASVNAADTNSVVIGNTAFALDLYGHLRTNSGNLFFSPHSISTCLAMVYAGARGNTEKQMAQAMRFGADQAQFHSAFGALQDQMNAARAKKEFDFNLANGLWAQKNHAFLPTFLDLVKQRYGANLEQVDFGTGAEPARKEINDWVSAQTRGKITDLLAPGVVDASTRLVLVNAIYFKGRWLHQFKAANTGVASFNITSNQQVQAPLMNLTASFKSALVDGVQVLELPYLGNDLSMAVLLPGEIDGLKKVEESLTRPQLDDWLGQMRAQEVNVFLPKFKLTGEFTLTDTLAAMGMADLFSPRADLSGMDGARDLFVSAVVHKAYVDVNEEGTEAAAATGGVVAASAFRPPPVFRADHPFLFLIRDNHSGSILFFGRVVDPTK